MKVIDKLLVASFREKRRCEYCGKPCPGGTDPHHIFARGSGQVDIKENLISLCREDHVGFHACGKPSRDELLAIVAKREGVTAEAITEKVWRLRRETKVKVWKVS